MKAVTNGSPILKVAVLLSVIFLTGCAGDIFRHQSVGGTSITVMDARQRAIIANQFRTVTETSSENKVKTSEVFMRFCAEPFPDIFTVVSSSVSAGVGAGATLDKEKQNAQANAVATIAAALKESGTAIERSQTVNLLGMSLYRTCERYMNGAITDEELKIQASRDQQAMISILAIEQLTNLARPAPTKIILDGGLAEAVASNVVSSEAAKKALNAAKANYEKAEKLKKDELSKSKLTDKCVFDDATAKRTCEDATDSFNSAGHALNKAQADFDKESNASISASAKVGSNQTTHIVINDNRKPDIDALSNETVKYIADAVVQLAKIGTKFDRCQYADINNIRSIRECNGTDKSDSSMLPVKSLAGTDEKAIKSCASIKNSNIVFYVQAQKNCDKCEEDAEEAKIIVNTLLRENCESLVSYPIEYLDAKNFPNKSEIRYFDESDKVMAEEIAATLKVSPKQFRLNASHHVIEYWVGKQ